MGNIARPDREGDDSLKFQVGMRLVLGRKRSLFEHSPTDAIGEPCPSSPVPHCSQQLMHHWLLAVSRKHDRISEIGHSDRGSRFVCSSTTVSRAPIYSPTVNQELFP